MSRLVVATTFAGIGGSCGGYDGAGLGVAYANELDPWCVETYELNADIRVDHRDVKLVRGEDILAAVGGELDVLDGSPPCQGFSPAAGAANLDNPEDRDLYWEFVRLVGEARPRAFVAENVKGFLAERYKRTYRLPILAALRAHGYSVGLSQRL